MTSRESRPIEHPRPTQVARSTIRPAYTGEGQLPGLLPRFDVLAQPEAHPTTTPIDHRSREIVVAAQIRRHRVVVREPEHHGDLTRRDQVFGVHPRSHKTTAYERRRHHATTS